MGELVALVGGLKSGRTSRPDCSAGHERRSVSGRNLEKEEVCLR